MTHPYNQPHPPTQPGRRVSGLAAALIAIVALGAGCIGGVAVAGAGDTAAGAAPAPAVTETVQAKSSAEKPEPEEAALPEAQAEESEQVELPDFTGQNAAVARQWLVDHGWDEYEDVKLGSQDKYDTFVILPENWVVTKQSHRAGSKVAAGTTIVLTCTKQ